MPKVLISDDLSPQAVAIFKDRGIDVDYKPGTKPDERELIELVKTRKGSAHAPKQVKFVPELPMTGVGKIDKLALKGLR